MSPRILAGLILTNLIWSAHPAMGKLVLESFAPAQGAWLRYASALLAYVAAVVIARMFGAFGSGSGPRLLAKPFLFPGRRRDRLGLCALGFFTFCFSPILQMTGLHGSRAVDNALIVAMEPLMTVLLAWIFLRERLRAFHWFSFALALGGFVLLSGLSGSSVSEVTFGANLLILISLAGEAAYSVIGRKMVTRFSPVGVFGSSLLFGVLILSVAAFSVAGMPTSSDFGNAGWESLVAILWLGPLGTTLSYLYWMVALVEAPVASVAITLFVQPLMGAFWGYLFLNERLSPTQALGGALILIAVTFPAMAAKIISASGARAEAREDLS